MDELRKTGIDESSVPAEFFQNFTGHSLRQAVRGLNDGHPGLRMSDSSALSMHN